jgi:hypothetical protein
MSEILSGTVTKRTFTQTPKLTTLLITGNSKLVKVTVGIHTTTPTFSGTYDGNTNSAAVYVSQSEYDEIGQHVALGNAVTVTHEASAVLRFWFPTTSVTVGIPWLGVTSGSVAPESGTRHGGEGALDKLDESKTGTDSE